MDDAYQRIAYEAAALDARGDFEVAFVKARPKH